MEGNGAVLQEGKKAHNSFVVEGSGIS